MPKYIFDFNLSCWIQRLEIEADNEEEAQEKLRKMPALDLVDYGYVHSSDISDVDVEVEDEDEDDYDDDDYEEDEESFEEKYNPKENESTPLEEFINYLIDEMYADLTYQEFKEMAEEKGLTVDMSDWRKYKRELNNEDEEEEEDE